MAHIFEIIDKTGRKIHISQERWNHICKHKGMDKYFEEIKETLSKPTIIVPNKFDEKRSNYYLYFKERKRYLLVGVKYLNGSGYITTSFVTRKIIKR